MKYLFLFVFISITAQSHAQSWFQLGIGANALKAYGWIYTICTDTNNNIYAAGQFTDSNHVAGHTYVAKWDHAMHFWTKLGTGANALNGNSAITSIATDLKGNVYAAGDFTNGSEAGRGFTYVAKWDGDVWSELGTGGNALNADGSINSICVDDSGNVYAAGNFRNRYGESYVARWDGSTWSELPGLNANLFINSICVDDSFNVYAAGIFSDSSGHTYVAKWDHATSSWSELGSGFYSAITSSFILAITVDDSFNIYAAVNFQQTPSGLILSNVFKYHHGVWAKVGNAGSELNANNYVSSLCLGKSGAIYAAGAFTNNYDETYVAKYDASANIWSELGTGANGLHPHNAGYGNKPPIYTLCADRNNNIYAAGNFSDSISFDDDYMYVAEYGISTLPVNGCIYKNESFSLYPNPAKGELNVVCHFNRLNAQCRVYIYDYTGVVVYAKEIHDSSVEEIKIDLSDLTAGSYIMKINSTMLKFNIGNR